MWIFIHPEAARRYVLSCYLSPRVGRPHLNFSWAEKVKTMQGRWMKVDTRYLFSDQFNAEAYRIMNPLVAAVRGDVRERPVHRFSEHLHSLYNTHPYFHREDILPMVGQLYDEWLSETGLVTSTLGADVDHIIRYVQGGLHGCYPIAPLIGEKTSFAKGDRRVFWYSSFGAPEKYSKKQSLWDGVLSLPGEKYWKWGDLPPVPRKGKN